MSEQRRVVPLIAQVTTGCETIERALQNKQVMPEATESAQACIRTLTWLSKNERALKLLARAQKHPDLINAIEGCLEAKDVWPDAEIEVKRYEPEGDL